MFRRMKLYDDTMKFIETFSPQDRCVPERTRMSIALFPPAALTLLFFLIFSCSVSTLSCALICLKFSLFSTR